MALFLSLSEIDKAAVLIRSGQVGTSQAVPKTPKGAAVTSFDPLAVTLLKNKDSAGREASVGWFVAGN